MEDGTSTAEIPIKPELPSVIIILTLKEFKKEHKTAAFYAFIRMGIFSVLLLTTLGASFYIAANPETVNQALRFRPIDSDSEVALLLGDHYKSKSNADINLENAFAHRKKLETLVVSIETTFFTKSKDNTGKE